jgi:hypothetical protein
MGGKDEKGNKAFVQNNNENPKCHLHIPQPRKGIYVLNIIIQSILEKKSEGKGPQRNTKNLNAPSKG